MVPPHIPNARERLVFHLATFHHLGSTGSSQTQQHSHPEDPEENEDGKRPQWLQQQERTAADGFICDSEQLNRQLHSLSEGENQGQENNCHDCGDDSKGQHALHVLPLCVQFCTEVIGVVIIQPPEDTADEQQSQYDQGDDNVDQEGRDESEGEQHGQRQGEYESTQAEDGVSSRHDSTQNPMEGVGIVYQD